MIYNWTISQVERELTLGTLSDVIKTVHYRYIGTDESETTAETYGAVAIGEPNPDSFTAWDKVTTSDVEGWLEAIFSVVPEVEEGEEPLPTELEKMKQNIQSKIDLINTPTTITSNLPTEEINII
jgi:hypothetical protein